MRTMRFPILAAALLLVVTGSAHADSDGYYCVGPDYLAYQFGLAAPPVRPHRLYVVRVGGDAGISETVVVELQQFQVHGMRCGASSIELLAFDATHVVDLDGQRRPVKYVAMPRPIVAGGPYRPTPPDWVGLAHNLGSLSRPVGTLEQERITLARDSRGHEYVLEITPSQVERCALDIVSRVIQTDASGKVIRSRSIFTGRGYRECGI